MKKEVVRQEVDVSGDGMFILDPSYRKYLVTPKDAVVLAQILSRALMYEEKYISGGGPNGTLGYTYHAWTPDPKENEIRITAISQRHFDIALIAGRPE